MRGTIKQKLAKAMDMRFCWVRDRVEQKNFEIKWKLGHINLGGSFKNHHHPMHHQRMQQTYVLNAIIAVKERILQGYAKTRNLGAGEHVD